MIYEYPLAWPVGVKRKGRPERSRFERSDSEVKRSLESELALMRATNIVVTTNVELRRDGRPYANQRLEDNGVAVYFNRKGHDQVIACDKWDSIKDNLAAIDKTIAALRGIERWGTGEMVDAAFTGFTALPEHASSGTAILPNQSWYDVLEVSPTASAEVIEAAYRSKLKTGHPDKGGSEAEFIQVQKAYAESKKAVRR